MLSPKQVLSVTIHSCKVYPILGWFQKSWATKELIIWVLTNKRDHKSHIEKVGGHAAWCTQLKDKRKAKKAGQGGVAKGKASEKNHSQPNPSNATNQAGGLSKVLNKAHDFPHGVIISCIQDSNNDFDNKQVPVPKPSFSKPKASNKLPKETPPAGDDKHTFGNSMGPAPISKTTAPKQKAKLIEEPNWSQKKAQNQSVEGTSNIDEPTSALKPSKGKANEAMVSIAPKMNNMQTEDKETPASLTIVPSDNKAIDKDNADTPAGPDAMGQDPLPANSGNGLNNKETYSDPRPACKKALSVSCSPVEVEAKAEVQAEVEEPTANKSRIRKLPPANNQVNNKRKTNGKNANKPPPAERLGLVSQLPAPTSTPSKSSNASPASKKNGKGRQAKQEPIDNVNGVFE
ncbi:hypothetical protein RHS03_08959, partial [Rhizoctonia solani]